MKSNSFSKKLISLFLAVIMALSCFTGAMSAFAYNSADTKDSLYDGNLAYNFLGWVETTDEQTLSALLDWADDMLGDNLGTMKGTLNVYVASVNYDLSSINGIFSTINSARELLNNSTVNLVLGGDAKNINLGACLKGYAATGSGNTVITRENSTSKEILQAIINILYMNTNDYAKNSNNADCKAGGTVLQQFINGNFSLGNTLDGIVSSALGNSLYGLIGSLLGMPSGYEKNLANNIVAQLLKVYVADDLVKDGVNNDLNTSGETYYFQKNGAQQSFEEWAFDAINNGVLDTLIGVDGEYIYKDSGFELNVGDKAIDDLYTAFIPVFQHTLLPLFSTISVDHNFVNTFTKLYYNYVTTQANYTAPTTQAQIDAYWTKTAVENWIAADYETIAQYLAGFQENGEYVYPDIAERDESGNVVSVTTTAAEIEQIMIDLFNGLDRNEDEIDATQLFKKVLYSPVAEALGCQTGVLNLNIKDTYFGNYYKVFDMSVLPAGGSVQNNLYGFLKELLSSMFPTFDNWAPASATQDVNGIVTEFVNSAFNLLQFVGDATSAAIFRDFYAANGSDATLSEDNVESAMIPFVKAAIGQIYMIQHIHQDTWDACADFESLLYVCLAEYLKYSLPEYDYSCLVSYDENGKLVVDFDTALAPMARDALAYVMQSSVPLMEADKGEWDVFKKGGTENGQLRDATTSVYDMLNKILCYYADDMQLAQLIGLTRYEVYGDTTNPYDSAITLNNDLFENLNAVANTAFPVLSTFFGKEAGTLDIEDLMIDSLVKCLLDIKTTDNTQYGHGKGITTMLYNFVYFFTESAPMTEKAILNVVYDFLRDIFNVIVGARDSQDGFGDFIPSNTGLQPFTDLIQTKVLSGGSKAPSAACGSVNSAGILGCLVGRIAENSLSGELYTKNSRAVQDTIIPGVAYLIKAVNSFIPSFVPQLTSHTLDAPTAEVNSEITNYQEGDDLPARYLGVTNNSYGLNRSYFEVGEDLPTQMSRYYIKVTNITCVNDANIGVDYNTRYSLSNGNYSSTGGNAIIEPAQTGYYLISGYTETPDEIKDFLVTYDIVDASGNVISDYSGYTVHAYMYVSTEANWFDSTYTYDSSSGEYHFHSNLVSNTYNETKYYPGTSVAATRVSYGLGDNNQTFLQYPTTVVLDSSEPETVGNATMRVYNSRSNNIFGSNERYIDSAYAYVGDDESAAIPAFDDAGNIIDYSRTDYYYPDLDQWLTENPEYTDANGTLYGYSQTRPHVEYTNEQAQALPGYNATFENGVCTSMTITYSTDYNGKISWGTPIKGLYLAVSTTSVTGGNEKYFKWVASNGENIEPGEYKINLRFTQRDSTSYGYASLDVKVSETSEKSELRKEYNDFVAFASGYLAGDFKDVAVYNQVQDAIKNATEALATPISVNSVVNNYKFNSDKRNTPVTGVSDYSYGDPAYEQLTTAPGGMASYASNYDEFGNRAPGKTYYYQDVNCLIPFYSNVPVTVTASTFDTDKYVYLDADGIIATEYKEGLTAYVKNQPQYEYAWVEASENGFSAPYYQQTDQVVRGKYLNIWYNYYDENGNMVRNNWSYKVAQVYEDIVPATVDNDTRGLYMKAIDTLKYARYVAERNINADVAQLVVDSVITNRAGLNENNFDKVTYQSMVKVAWEAEALVSPYYDEEFKPVTVDDEDYKVSSNYQFRTTNGTITDYTDDTVVATTTHAVFVTNLLRGDYVQYGLTKDSVEGVDYIFGYMDATDDFKDEDGNIVYKYSTSSSGLAVKEAIRLYEFYRSKVMHRGYIDSDYALMEELLCATGDAYNYGYDQDALRNYLMNNYTSTVATYDEETGAIVSGANSVTYANKAAAPKYGTLDANGVLVNLDQDGNQVYTTESWDAFIAALAAVINSVNTAATSAGYTQTSFDSTVKYDHQVTALNTLRENVMRAENNLEPATPAATTATITGQILPMTNPSDPDVSTAKNGVADVAIIIDGETVATTDANGNYSFELESGTYTATVSYAYGADRQVTIVVDGTKETIEAPVITVVMCDYDKGGIVNVSDVSSYKSAVNSKDLVKADLNRDGSANVSDTSIMKSFFSKSNIQNIYTPIEIA